MDLITEILIGISLAMDASAVSIAGGANKKYKDRDKDANKIRAALLAALFFGGFQALMLIFGILGGEGLKNTVSGIDHWIAFGLLGFIGGKMILEAFRSPDEKKVDLLDIRVLVLLAIATSIDALVVGAGIAFANHSLVSMSLVVGIITGVLSFLSVFVGSRWGSSIGKNIEVVGGVILILIGLNILRNHLM